jgi:hypothetical protein
MTSAVWARTEGSQSVVPTLAAAFGDPVLLMTGTDLVGLATRLQSRRSKASVAEEN